MRYVLIVILLILLIIAGCGDEVQNNNLTLNDSAGILIDNEDIECNDDTNADIEPEDVPVDDLEEEITAYTIEPEDEPETMDISDDNLKSFIVIAENYRFIIEGKINPEIKVKKGDRVIIELKSAGGSHNWNVNQLAVRSKTVITNETTTLEFNTTIIGTFDYYCAVGKHRHIGDDGGMEGKFIVE